MVNSTSRQRPQDHRAERNQAPSRRRFLLIVIRGVYGLITAILGIPFIVYLISPARMTRRTQWIRLGSISRFKEEEWTKVAYEFRRRDGWVVAPVKKLAYVTRDFDDGFVVFSNECTHLGCGVRWDKEARQFLCPCHDGKFDDRGEVVAGPPPRPLIRYKTRVEDEQLFIEET